MNGERVGVGVAHNDDNDNNELRERNSIRLILSPGQQRSLEQCNVHRRDDNFA